MFNAVDGTSYYSGLSFVRGQGDNAGQGLVETYRPRDPQEFDRVIEMVKRGALKEAMTADDLPVILAAGVDTQVRNMYVAVPKPWAGCFKTASFPNFREQTIARLLEVNPDNQKGNATASGTYPAVPAGHGYDEARLSEYHEHATLATYGGVFSVTREMLINDDLGQIQDLSANIGRAMVRTENWHIVDTLEKSASTSVSGRLCADGYNLFETSSSTGHHANMTSSALPLSAAAVKAEAIKFGQQTAPDGQTLFKLGIKPKYLIVPAELELTAFEIVSAAALIGAGTTVQTSANVMQERLNLQVVVIPQLTNAKDWYLAADANEGPTVEMGYLRGVQTPTILTQRTDGINLAAADGQQYKIRHDFVAYPAAYSFMRKIDDTT